MSAMALDPAVRLIARGTLSLLFVWAASHKLRDLTGFRSALANYELLPRRGLGVFAALLPAVEIGVAAALLLSGWAASAALAAAVLFALYAGAIFINLVRGRRDIDCGCAGVAAKRSLSGGLVVRNGVLIIAALASALPATSRLLIWVDVVTIVVGVAAAALLYAAADGLLATAPQIAALAHDRIHAMTGHEATHA